ncbi:hypothetical protein BCR34DRAFT_629917 [Clohesyomyces aquaticus]|uniref:GST N-terminal domain-containing protein n=1 Tax=Clohesyomyces aquaticus TaxID=1231657 RepID=A0A1Y2ABC6_9PLEO|nr:hypothetical protein BCR34DRAFT_629917 [Clohesyomyces aquaticus]
MPASTKPILFHYPPSIFSHRVLWYLWLRGIPYDECIQPAYMPRPDLADIEVRYRRIPIMAIGSDVYCDSQLIIRKLEAQFPKSTLTPPSAADLGVQKLLQNWTIYGGVFSQSVRLIPYWTPDGLLSDEKFLDDRQKLMGGGRMTAELMEQSRPEGLVHMRQAFDMVENSLLADSRKWILGTENPTVADIDGVWPFEWLIVGMPGALSEAYISEKSFPKTFTWVHRFMKTVEAAKDSAPKPDRLNGEAAKERATSASGTPMPTAIIKDDPLKLREGDEVQVYALDYGASHKDRGSLVGLSINEVVIRNSEGLHLHFPRWNFRVEKCLFALPHPDSQKMRLISHYASRYTRKVFMLALELGLEKSITLQKVVISYLVPEDVPDGIFDSRIICEYLEYLATVSMQKDARYWQMRTLHATADGIMDEAVLIVYELRIREERGLRFDEWITGQKLKITRALDRFEHAAQTKLLVARPTSGLASADDVAVACVVGTADQMSILWRDARPALVAWYRNWEERRSFQLLLVTKEWKTGSEAELESKI